MPLRINMKTKTAYMGLLLAFAFILSYIEMLLPLQVGIPGVKLGLANMAVLLCLYLFDTFSAFLLTVSKAVLTGFLFGNLSMIIYSLAGAIFSFIVMLLLKKSGRFHIPVISAMGGVAHNAAQLLIAYFMIETYAIIYYVPILIVSGLVTGILIGITVNLLLPLLRKVINRGGNL